MPFLLPGIYIVTIEDAGVWLGANYGIGGSSGDELKDRDFASGKGHGRDDHDSGPEQSSRDKRRDFEVFDNSGASRGQSGDRHSGWQVSLNSVGMVIPGVSPGLDPRGEDLIVNGSRHAVERFL